MARRVRIDFVSDVVCPWCAIGLLALERAIARLGDGIEVDLHVRPFELNPQMPPEGEDATAHLQRKYGASVQQLAQNREAIRARGAALGFVFNPRDRIHNTFDAHRLLHWAGLESSRCQLALKHALLRAYFTEGRDVSDPATLAAIAGEAGLDAARARGILASDEFAADVREEERFYVQRGIHAVPSVILDHQHLVQGGQPVEVFEQALRQVAATPAS